MTRPLSQNPAAVHKRKQRAARRLGLRYVPGIWIDEDRTIPKLLVLNKLPAGHAHDDRELAKAISLLLDDVLLPTSDDLEFGRHG